MALLSTDISLPNVTSNEPFLGTPNPLVPAVSPLSGGDNSDNELSQLPLEQRIDSILNKNRPSSDALSITGATPAISIAERNANARYPHFIPGIDNEEYAAMNQSWLSQLGHSLVKFGATAAGTFVDSFLSFPGAVSASKSGIKGLYDNSLESSIDEWLQNLEDKFPNYYTKWEQEHPFLSAITPTGAANFWGENILKNMGFTVGAIGGSLAQDFLIGAVTGGIGEVVNIPAQVGKLALYLNRIFATSKDIDKTLDAARGAEKVFDIAKLRQIAKVSQGTENVFNKARYVTSLLGAARTEAAVEARQGYNTMRDTLIQEYKDAHGGEGPDADTLADIEKTATASANTRFLANMAILTLSDAVQFDALFSTFNTGRRMLSKVANVGANKIGLKAGSLDTFEEVVPKSVIARFFRPKDLLTTAFSEGVFEEGSQYVAQEATQNYYHAKYYDENKSTFNDILKSTAFGFSQAYGTTEGLENVFAGAIMGAVTGPISRRITKNRDAKASKLIIDALNSQSLTGTFEQKYEDAANALDISKGMQKAIETGNIFDYKNLKHKAFFNFINSALRVNRFDVRVEQLEALKDLGDEEFTERFGLVSSDENRKTVNQFVDGLVSKANQIKNDYNAINRSFPNPYVLINNPKNEDEALNNLRYLQHNEWIDTLNYYSAVSKDAEDRVSSILSRWAKVAPAVKEGAATAPLTQEGIEGLVEKYKTTNPQLSKEIENFIPELKSADYIFSDDLFEKFLPIYGKILSQESGYKFLTPVEVRQIAVEAGDINAINARKQDAIDAYNNLATSTGKEKFIEQDDKLRENDKAPSSVPSKTTVKTNNGSKKDIDFELIEGKNYHIFTEGEDTPDGVKSRKSFSFKINKITNDGKIHVTTFDGKNMVFKRETFEKLDTYSDEEMGSPSAQYYLHAVQRNQRYTMPIKVWENGKLVDKTVYGSLQYFPNNDSLGLNYWDGNKIRFKKITLDQIDNKNYTGKYPVKSAGALTTNIELGNRAAKSLQAERIKDANLTRQALSISIQDYKESVDRINKQIEEHEEALSKAQSKLEGYKKRLDDNGAVHISVNSAVSTLNKLNKVIKDTQKALEDLYNTKNDFEYTLDYLQFVHSHISEEGEDIDNTIAQIEDSISSLEDNITRVQKRINLLERIYNTARAAYKEAKGIIDSVLKAFSRNHEGFRYEDIQAVLNSKNPFEHPYVPESLQEDIAAVEATLIEENKRANITEKTISSTQSKIKTLQQEIETYKKEQKVLYAHLKSLSDAVAERNRLLEEQERFQKDERYHKEIFGEVIKTSQKGDPTNPPGEDKDHNESSLPPASIIFIKGSIPERNSQPTKVQERYNTLLNNARHLSNRSKMRIILVTKNNEDKLGLSGITALQYPTATPEQLTDPKTGLIITLIGEQDDKGEFHPINEKGGKTTDINEMVWSVLPSASLKTSGGFNRYRSGEKDAAKEELEKFIPFREQVFNTDNPIQYPFTISRGFANADTSNPHNNVVETGLVSPDELEKERVIQISKDGHITYQGRAYNVPSGRPMLVHGDAVQFLNNRNLTSDEADAIYVSLLELAKKAQENFKNGESKILDRKLLTFLRGVLYWGNPREGKSPARNQIWIGNDGELHIGKSSIPFTVTGIQDQKDKLYTFLRGTYNSANSNLLSTNPTYVEYDKDLQPIEWRSYQEYLLSPTYQLLDTGHPLHGKSRSNVPLSVNLQRGNIPYSGKYAVLQGVQYEKPAKKEKPKQKKSQEAGPQPSLNTDGETPNTIVYTSPKSGNKYKLEFTATIEEGSLNISVDPEKFDGPKAVKIMSGALSDEQIPNELTKWVSRALIDNGIVDQNGNIIGAPKPPPTKETNNKGSNNDNNEDDIDVQALLNSLAQKPPSKEFRRVVNTNEPRINSEDWSRFLDWMRRNLPQFEPSQMEHLARTLDGGMAWGYLEGNLIKVFKSAARGTEYHEAFEGVWKFFVSPQHQQRILYEVRRRPGKFLDQITGEKISYKSASDAQLKEKIADEFGQFVYEKTTEPNEGILAKIFRAIVNFFNNLTKYRGELGSLFKSINSGYYSTSQSPIPTNSSKEYSRLFPAQVSKDINDEIVSSVMNQVFGEGKSLFNIEGDNLSKDLYDTALSSIDNAFTNAYVAIRDSQIPQEAKLDKVKNLEKIRRSIHRNWDDIVSENKQFVKIFGFEFVDNGGLEFNDENRNHKEYDKDFYKIDPIKSASKAIKILLSTLTERVPGEKADLKDVFGNPKEVLSSIGGGKLIDFAKVFTQIMDKMEGKGTLSAMMDELVQMGHLNASMIPLFRRLGGDLKTGKIQYESLNYDQWRLLINFYSAFSKQKPTAIFQYVRNGKVLSRPASINDLIKVQNQVWIENIKALSKDKNSIVKYDRDSKTYKVDKSNLPKKYYTKDASDDNTARPNEIALLKKFGIEIPQSVVDVMSKADRRIFTDTARTLYDLLKDFPESEVPILTTKYLSMEGIFNKFSRVFVNATQVEPFSVFFDENGEYRQNYVPHNPLSKFVNTFNDAKTLSDLGPISTDEFSKNSIILSKFFDKDGNKIANGPTLNTGYIMANINEDSGFNTSLTAMTYAMRLSTEINQNFNGWYYTISSVDSNTEHMINWGNNVPESSVTTRSNFRYVSDIFIGYLKDEIALIENARAREDDNAYMRKANNARKLRFLEDILSDKTKKDLYKILDDPKHTQNQIDSFINGYASQIAGDVKSYFMSMSNSLLDTLIYNGIVNTEDGEVYNWPTIDNSIHAPTFLTKNDILDTILFAEVNFAVNNIESFKLIYGDPAQRSTVDILKRSKLYNSPRGSTYNEPQYDEWANKNNNKSISGKTLSKNELGYVHYKPYANTVVFRDISVISELSMEENLPEDIAEEVSKYHEVDETDAGGIIMPWGLKQLLEKTGEWDNNADTFYKEDMALARYELSQSGDYEYQDDELKKEDEKIATNGQYIDHILSVKKPAITGSKYDSAYIDTIVDKLSLFPLTWGLARTRPNMREFFIRMFNNKAEDGTPRDYAVPPSARKIGVNQVDTLFTDSGKVNTDNFKSDTKVGYDIINIISEVNYKDGNTVTQGTQLTNLAVMDLLEGGIPQDFSGADWYSLNEQERENQSNLYKKIKRYQKSLKERTNFGFQALLKRWGVEDLGNYYEISDKKLIANVLQNEMFRRLLPKNILDAIKIDPSTNDFVIPLEATNVYPQIKSILMSQIDKAFVSPKVNGLSAVQVPSTLFEPQKGRSFAYKGDDGKYHKISKKKLSSLTEDQRKTIRIVADTYKFYKPTIVNGKVTSVGRAEIGISSKAIRKALKGTFSELNDEELLNKLNNSPDGQKVLQAIAFRIPTSGINLVEALTIKEFLPEYYGDTVVVPSEITKKSGSDFDIDKLNIYLNNFYVDTEGNIQIVKYFEDISEHNKFYGDLFEKIFDKKKQALKGAIERADFKAGVATIYLDNISTEINGGEVSSLSEQIIKDNQKYLDSIFGDVDSIEEAEQIVNTFVSKLQELSNQEEILDATKEATKDTFVENMRKKALQNEFFDSTQQLILDPINFKRLIRPNDASTLTGLRDKLHKKIKPSSPNTNPVLNRQFLSRYRHNNLVGKINVGVYSLSQIYNTMMQQHQVVIDPNRIASSSLPDFQKKILGGGIPRLRHKSINGLASLSNIYDVDNNFVSDTINQAVSGAVDMSKDQFLSELGFVEQRGPVAMAMIRLGISPDTVIAFINQPIVLEYINYLNSKNTKNLLIENNVKVIKDKFSGGFSSSIKESSLWNNVGKTKLTANENAEQRVILDEFLFYAVIAKNLLAYNQGLNYDRANFTDTTFIPDKLLSTQRAIKNNIISSAEDILSNTHLGEIRNNLIKSRDVLGEIFTFENASIRPYLDEIKANFFQENQVLNAKAKKKIGRLIETSFINYLYQIGNPTDLSSDLVDPSTALADKIWSKFEDVKHSSPEVYSQFSSNPIITELKIITREGKTRNLSLQKKKVDPNSANLLTDALREIKNNIYTADIYKDIVTLSLLQSGIENSPISFTQFIPVEDYGAVISPLIKAVDNYIAESYLQSGAFFRNNWKNDDVVPSVKERYNDFYGLFPYASAPASLRRYFKENNLQGSPIGLSDKYNSSESKYPFVTITNNKPGYSKTKRDMMANNRDFSFRQTALYQRVVTPDGNPAYIPNADGSRTYIYKPVNAWGDGYYAQEYYSSPRQSALNNDTVKIQREVSDDEILSTFKYKAAQVETIDYSPTKPPEFTEEQSEDEGTDYSDCPF